MKSRINLQNEVRFFISCVLTLHAADMARVHWAWIGHIHCLGDRHVAFQKVIESANPLVRQVLPMLGTCTVVAFDYLLPQISSFPKSAGQFTATAAPQLNSP